jgi:hypothetical protein
MDKKTKDTYYYHGEDWNQNELWNQLVKEGNTKRFSELTNEEKKIKNDRFAIYCSSTGGVYAVVRDSAKDRALKALDSLKKAVGVKDGEYKYLQEKLKKIRNEIDRYKRAGQEDSPEYQDLQKQESKIGYALMNYINRPNKDSISVGKHNDVPDDKFNADQLALGIKTEMEHTDDPDVAKSIAKDHLMEIPDYYTRLLKMEKEAKG